MEQNLPHYFEILDNSVVEPCFGLVKTDNRFPIQITLTGLKDIMLPIDSQTPSFAIALYPEYRKFGIGKALMRRMLLDLKMSGYRKASLAVQKANYAVKLYQRVGFEIYSENEQEYIMLCELHTMHDLHLKGYDRDEKERNCNTE